MKKIAIIAGLSLSFLIVQVSLAQEQNEDKIKDRQAYDKQEKDMSSKEDEKKMDKDVTEKAQKDLATRYPDVDDAVVTWDRSDHGYHAIYRTDAGDYMALYDGNGNWVETMKKSNWDNSVPPYIKAGINENSTYKDYTVDSYWEVYESNGTNAKSYYFNLKNKEGKYKNLRMNEEGKVIDNTDY